MSTYGFVPNGNHSLLTAGAKTGTPRNYEDIPLIDHFDGTNTVKVRAYSLPGPPVDPTPFDDGSIETSDSVGTANTRSTIDL